MSAVSRGSRPVAWAIGGPDGTVLDSHIYHTESIARRWADATNRCVVPLYTHQVPPDRPVGLGCDDMRLTDAEHLALCRARDAYAANSDDDECVEIAIAIRGLLERLG